MKKKSTAVFIHDHNFFHNRTENQFYDTSGGAFDPKLWERYLKIFDSLIVVGRETKKVSNKLILSSRMNVDFFLIDDLKKAQDRFLKRKLVSVKLETIIKNIDFAVIRLPSTLGYFAISVCKKVNKPYILEIVGDPFDAYWNYGNISGKIMAPIEAFKMKYATKKAKAAIYVTKEHLQNKYPCLGLKEGISNVRLDEVVSLDYVNEFYRRDADVLKIGLIGSFLVQYKGHIEALRAIKELVENKNFKNLKLYLVGSGDSSWVKQLVLDFNIQNYVEIVGTLKSGNDGILPFLDKLHLLINPSKQEGLPRVVIEAMSRGKICLASTAGGTPELLKKEFLHRPGDWKTLSHQILKIQALSAEDRIRISKINLDTGIEYLESNLQLKREKLIIKTLRNFHESSLDAN